jgi:hypothetical protein
MDKLDEIIANKSLMLDAMHKLRLQLCVLTTQSIDVRLNYAKQCFAIRPMYCSAHMANIAYDDIRERLEEFGLHIEKQPYYEPLYIPFKKALNFLTLEEIKYGI